MPSICDRLQAIVGAEGVHESTPLSSYTSFQIGGPAEWLVEPRTEEEIAQILKLCREQCLPLNVMGLGSNILVADQGVTGVVLRLADRFSSIELVENISEAGELKSQAEVEVQATRYLYAQAGASNEAVSSFALEHSLTGYEFASGIPGSIGGAAIMNAGAYGGEFKDVAISVRCLTSEGETLEVNAAEAQWSYRHSLMMDRGYIVLGATLVLLEGDPAVIAATMADLKCRREEKQPLEMPSAGSTFKRPEGHYAGQLIQEAGLRGYRVGGAQVSDKHCGFVVNANQATAKDIRDLIAYVQKRVQDTSGVYLEPEVRLWGFPGEFRGL